MSVHWTLTAIASRATAALGNRTDIAYSTVSFWANEAQREVWDAFDHDAEEGLAVSSTTSGEDKITLPADFQAPINFVLWGSTSTSTTASHFSRDVLTLMDPDLLDSQTTKIGKPTQYLPFDDYIQLFPIPNSDYSIQLRYEKQLSSLVTDADTISVATRYGRAVLFKTIELLAHEVRDEDAAQIYARKFAQTIALTPTDRGLRMKNRHDLSVSLPRKRL